jgi:hypothetical protein
MPLLRIFRLVQEVSREDGLSALRSPSRTSGEPRGKLSGYRVSVQVSVSLNGRDTPGRTFLRNVRPFDHSNRLLSCGHNCLIAAIARL